MKLLNCLLEQAKIALGLTIGEALVGGFLKSTDVIRESVLEGAVLLPAALPEMVAKNAPLSTFALWAVAVTVVTVGGCALFAFAKIPAIHELLAWVWKQAPKAHPVTFGVSMFASGWLLQQLARQLV